MDEDGERVPLTVAGTDPVRGTVTIIFQKVGYSTKRLDCLNVGDYILFLGSNTIYNKMLLKKRFTIIANNFKPLTIPTNTKQTTASRF